ncbi:hypothetical protein M2454_002813 [Aequitasia blattaphilus]|uniref:TetR family transcriptional regulator C-terminal domain-containing protein n=1 Tax=Aequitasia blattaphilus TaxID=2949332 RepID=A0ABT1ECZ0_9FIRM|nr:TetR-like C-terminal domain-containing protein [Aequitasia blattaphilus]MCP1103708.1 TetR family transcriptional regulator C-terminal domain-containing protein [Aequitasia blattaphilus]MCR8616348.1 TetR family transcriptional regulator C-terminal domain-containing protein [Aequitasia blattaphilus]
MIAFKWWEHVTEFLAVFYTNACAGILMDWVKDKFRQDKKVILDDMLLICKVSMPQVMLARVEKHT